MSHGRGGPAHDAAVPAELRPPRNPAWTIVRARVPLRADPWARPVAWAACALALAAVGVAAAWSSRATLASGPGAGAALALYAILAAAAAAVHRAREADRNAGAERDVEVVAARVLSWRGNSAQRTLALEGPDGWRGAVFLTEKQCRVLVEGADGAWVALLRDPETGATSVLFERSPPYVLGEGLRAKVAADLRRRAGPPLREALTDAPPPADVDVRFPAAFAATRPLLAAVALLVGARVLWPARWPTVVLDCTLVAVAGLTVTLHALRIRRVLVSADGIGFDQGLRRYRLRWDQVRAVTVRAGGALPERAPRSRWTMAFGAPAWWREPSPPAGPDDGRGAAERALARRADAAGWDRVEVVVERQSRLGAYGLRGRLDADALARLVAHAVRAGVPLM